jgi:hypothetical protein
MPLIDFSNEKTQWVLSRNLSNQKREKEKRPPILINSIEGSLKELKRVSSQFYVSWVCEYHTIKKGVLDEVKIVESSKFQIFFQPAQNRNIQPNIVRPYPS